MHCVVWGTVCTEHLAPQLLGMLGGSRCRRRVRAVPWGLAVREAWLRASRCPQGTPCPRSVRSRSPDSLMGCPGSWWVECIMWCLATNKRRRPPCRIPGGGPAVPRLLPKSSRAPSPGAWDTAFLGLASPRPSRCCVLTGDSGCLPVKRIGLGSGSHTSLCRCIRQPGTRCLVSPQRHLEIKREEEWTWRTWKLKGKMCPPSLYLSLFHTPSSSALSSIVLSIFLSFILSFFLLLPSLSPPFLYFLSPPHFLPSTLSFSLFFLSVPAFKRCVQASACSAVGSQLEVEFWCPFWAQLFLPGSISVLCCLPCSFLHQYVV